MNGRHNTPLKKVFLDKTRPIFLDFSGQAEEKISDIIG